ncbi:MAG: hypothetical protein WBA44_09155 [Mesorhizobium sp.]
MSSTDMCRAAIVRQRFWAVMVVFTTAAYAAQSIAQESPSLSSEVRRITPIVGRFVLDEDYPRNPARQDHPVNFGLIRQRFGEPQDAYYFIFPPAPDVFSIAEKARSSVLALLGPCDESKERPPWGVQRIGSQLERMDGYPELTRYTARSPNRGSVFVPVLKNLRLYEPSGSGAGFEWLKRAAREHDLCFSYKAVGFYVGDRASGKIRLSDYAEFEYR